MAALIAVAALTFFGGPGRQDASSKKALDSLYEEALEDERDGSLLDSISKLNQITKIDPSYAKAVERLESSIDKALAEAEKKIAEGKPDEAKEITDRLTVIAPGNKKIKKVIAKLPADGVSGPPPAGQPVPGRLDDPNAAPGAIVPEELDGYELKHKWDDGGLAGAAYAPSSPALAQEVETVLLTVGKLTPSDAKERLEAEKALFPDEAAELKVNGHNAYSGYSAAILVVTWTQDEWFFSVQIIPGNKAPSLDLMRGVANDVADKLGV